MNRTIHMIPGTPLSMCPDKTELEKEQPGLELQECPYCNQPMWVSAKKRKMLKEQAEGKNFNVDMKLLCWLCIKISAEFGTKPKMQQI